MASACGFPLPTGHVSMVPGMKRCSTWFQMDQWMDEWTKRGMDDYVRKLRTHGFAWLAHPEFQVEVSTVLIDISTYMTHSILKLNVSQPGLTICPLPHVFSFILISLEVSLFSQISKVTISKSETLLSLCLQIVNQVLIDATSQRVSCILLFSLPPLFPWLGLSACTSSSPQPTLCTAPDDLCNDLI